MDYIIIVAGGKGLRMGAEIPKQFLPVKGKPVGPHLGAVPFPLEAQGAGHGHHITGHYDRIDYPEHSLRRVDCPPAA